MDNLRFFEKTADPRTAVARAIGDGACEGLKPRSFEELVLRVYCRDSAKLPAAREAFSRWCKVLNRCNETFVFANCSIFRALSALLDRL